MADIRDGWSKAQIIASIITPILLFLFGTIFTLQQRWSDAATSAQRTKAESERRTADDQQKSIDRVASLVKDLNSEKPAEQEAAILLLIREKDKHVDFPVELLASALPTLVTVSSDPNAAIAKLAKTLLDELYAKTNFRLTVAEPVAVAPSVAPIFFQIQSDEDRDPARQIQAKLDDSGKGLKVQGIQRVHSGPKNTEIRYFHKSDDEKRRADGIRDILRGAGITDAQTSYVPGYDDSDEVRPNQVEIWFGPNSLGTKPH